MSKEQIQILERRRNFLSKRVEGKQHEDASYDFAEISALDSALRPSKLT